MDGTLVDYDGGIRDGLAELASPEDLPISDDIHHVPMYLEKRMDLIKSIPGFWKRLKPIRPGFDVYEVLNELGYTCSVLTKGPNRTRSAWTEKAEWCDHHCPGINVIIVDAKDPHEHKGLVYGKVLFDDFPPYVEAWLEYRPRGKAIMLEYPYNKDFEHPRVLKINQELSTQEIANKVKAFLD